MSSFDFLSLRIKNFKAFRGEHEFDLAQKPGLFYVSGINKVAPELGANGVGKSTIWDAVFWCLWGKTIRDARPAGAVQPWDGGKPTEVVLEFAFDHPTNDGALKIKRTRSPNALTLENFGKVRDLQQEEIPRILGMTEEMMRRAIILGQFGTLFLDLKPEAQSQMFTEALSLDTWIRASENAALAEKRAAGTIQSANIDIEVKRALITNLTEQIGESKKQGDLWEADRKARIAKAERGVAQLERDMEKLAVVREPKAPDTKALDGLTKRLSDARVGHATKTAEWKIWSQKMRSAQSDYDLLAGQKGNEKTCPACGQVISDKSYKEKLIAARLGLEAAQEQNGIREVGVMLLDVEIKKLKEQIDEAEDQGQLLQKDYKALLKAWGDYSVTIRANQSELRRLKEEIEREGRASNVFAQSVEVNDKRRTKEREMLSDLQTDLGNAEIDGEEAKYWVQGFKEIRLSIVDQVLIELEMASARHASMLGLNDWGIRFDTERELASGKVSTSFTVLLYPPGEDEPVKWESYSGGESQRWQMAVAFALSEVLLSRAGIKPNIEVLDEPTKGMSSQGVDDLLEHLRDRALELGRAIYFVDHHSLDKGAFDGTLLITKGRKGSSAAWL